MRVENLDNLQEKLVEAVEEIEEAIEETDDEEDVFVSRLSGLKRTMQSFLGELIVASHKIKKM